VSRDEYNLKILAAYTDFYQFTGLDFDIAVRYAERSFVLFTLTRDRSR
jgi:Sec7-like guanine-nucleotide exchange factor